jgi:hypothetical protein
MCDRVALVMLIVHARRYVSDVEAVGASLVLHHQQVSATNHPEAQLLDPQKNVVVSYEVENLTLLG